MSHDEHARSIGSAPRRAALVAVALIALPGCQNGRLKQPTVALERSVVTRIFTPAWYEVDPEEADGRFLATAQAVGANPTIAEALAINQARQSLALTIEARVDVLQRNFQEQIEAADDLRLLQRFQDVNTVVASQSLRGSVVRRKETYVEPDGTYRTFVLMELDNRVVDAAYLDRLKQADELETRLRSGEAWAELERRARELREERARGGTSPLTDREIMGDPGG